MPTLTTSNVSPLEPNFQKFKVDGLGWVMNCQDAGPRHAFRSLLDSGATYPSLYRADLQKLAIDENMYACQAVQEMSTANGRVTSRIFELFVCVLDNDNKQLVKADDPSVPYAANYLGGLCPVVENNRIMNFDVHGRETGVRLSGMLAFVACYVSSAPSMDMLFLGEDRNDVLGTYRIPGARRWHIDLTPDQRPREDAEETFRRWGNPRIAFLHGRLDSKGKEQTLTDVDVADKTHASIITGPGGAVRNCPAEDYDAVRRKEEQERAELEAKQKAYDEHIKNPAWLPGRAQHIKPPLV